ncbi:acyltransferase family protein [Streptomyces sp. NBC_01190]|uniref:acyltransferase family protein n=1 Tax=Streptomyces sp. NBC_01190 TaxID=2903767 RepID=UPI0038694168|nr:acyltransferase [Streptomyces sp. NBC_01190]
MPDTTRESEAAAAPFSDPQDAPVPAVAPASPPARQAHVAALDSLRALAVLAVILYHTGQLRCGWLGVPMFFALSGHFITRTLLSHPELSRGQRARNFFRNRLLRLAPLYFLFVAALTVYSIAGGGDSTLSRDLPYLWTWTWNLSALLHDFHPTSLVLYAQVWSLGVEVQLYVIWALLALLLPRRWFVGTSVVLAFAGPLLRWAVWLLADATNFPIKPLQAMVVYCNPLCYLDVFAIGALTALPEARRYLRGFAAAAVALFTVVTATMIIQGFADGTGFRSDLGYPVLLATHDDWVWKYSVAGLFFGAVIYYTTREGRHQQVLSWRPLVRIGIISYGIYLLHLVVLGRIFDVHQPTVHGWTGADLAVAAIGIAAAYLVAEVSYRLIERPFLRRKKGSLAQELAAENTPSSTSVAV